MQLNSRMRCGGTTGWLAGTSASCCRCEASTNHCAQVSMLSGVWAPSKKKVVFALSDVLGLSGVPTLFEGSSDAQLCRIT